MLTILWILVGIAVLGLVVDAGLMAAQGARLDHATDAAAYAAARACWRTVVDDSDPKHPFIWHYMDPYCAQQTAAWYLRANMPAAQLVAVTVAPWNQVNVQATTAVPHLFAPIWGTSSVKFQSASAASR